MPSCARIIVRLFWAHPVYYTNANIMLALSRVVRCDNARSPIWHLYWIKTKTYAKIIRSVEIPEFWDLCSYSQFGHSNDVPKPVFSKLDHDITIPPFPRYFDIATHRAFLILSMRCLNHGLGRRLYDVRYIYSHILYIAYGLSSTWSPATSQLAV